MAFAQEVKEKFGVPDVLVNNAGTYIPGSLIDEPDTALDFMLDVNLKSAYRLTRAFLREMVARKSGAIFNVGSIGAVYALRKRGRVLHFKIWSIGLYRNAPRGTQTARNSRNRRFAVERRARLRGTVPPYPTKDLSAPKTSPKRFGLVTRSPLKPS